MALKGSAKREPLTRRRVRQRVIRRRLEPLRAGSTCYIRLERTRNI